MKYYQEISLAHRANIGLYDFWQKLYQQIHFALVENKVDKHASAIGVSFPEYDGNQYLLGCKLRLFSHEKSILEQLQCEKWLNRLTDYVDLKPITLVPGEIVGHACFKQVRMKGGKEKLARRRAKRKGETFQQALSHYADYKEPRSKLPYINMMSLTNGQRFRLFIERQVKDQQKAGFFSSYGLSDSSTVPLF